MPRSPNGPTGIGGADGIELPWLGPGCGLLLLLVGGSIGAGRGDLKRGSGIGATPNGLEIELTWLGPGGGDSVGIKN